MTERLQVSLNSPQCGWMSVGFTYHGQEFHTTTAHAPYEGALTEMLEVLSDIIGGGEDVSRRLRWNREPEAFDFVFQKQGGRAALDIVQYPDEERRGEEGEIVFSWHGEVPELAAAFHETFEQLYKDRETDEFAFNWRQPFPLEAYGRFEQAMRG
jgi:hypothetical protein